MSIEDGFSSRGALSELIRGMSYYDPAEKRAYREGMKHAIDWVVENMGLDCFDCPANCEIADCADCKTALLIEINKGAGE